MAYVNQGTSTTTNTVKWKVDTQVTNITKTESTITLKDNLACCFVLRQTQNNIKFYEFRSFEKNTDKYVYKFDGTSITHTTYTSIEKDGTTTQHTETAEGTITIPVNGSFIMRGEYGLLLMRGVTYGRGF